MSVPRAAPSFPVRFLLVEDDEGHASLVQLAFAEHHIANSVDWVHTGDDALAYLRGTGRYADRTRPDVVLLDLKLPGMSGYEVLSAIKSDVELCAIPVVVLTTSSDEHDRARAYRAHANSYVVKPIDFREFHRMIRDLERYWSVWNAPPPAPEAGRR